MDQRMINKNRIGKIVCVVFMVIDIIFLRGLFHDSLDDIESFLTPVLVICTMIMFGVSIALLWENQKSIWERILSGFGFYMLLYIPIGIIAFIRGIAVSAFWGLIVVIFIIILLVDLIICITRKVLKSKSSRISGTRILGVFMLLLASMTTFLLSLCFVFTIVNATFVEKKHNFMGYYLVGIATNPEGEKYNYYVYCSEEEYMNTEINKRYRMEYVNCTIFPMARLKDLDTPSENMEPAIGVEENN
ncbi:MAG: hypothetical protein QM793_07225 [Muricomes sp.]